MVGDEKQTIQITAMAKDIEYIKRSLDDINEKLDSFSEEVKDTNGKVRDLENWQTSAKAILSLIKWLVGVIGLTNILGIVYWVTDFISKVQGQ